MIRQHIQDREQLRVLQAKQTEHRETLEAKVTASNIESSKRGQWLAFAIATAGMLVCALAIVKGYPIPGIIGVFADLALLASVFIYGNERRIDDLQHEMKLLMGGEREKPQP